MVEDDSKRVCVESAQAAGRGVKRMRSSAELAAPGESVLREFLQSVLAACRAMKLALLFSIAAVLGAQQSAKQTVQSAPAQPQANVQPQASQGSDDETRPTFQTSLKEVMAPVTVTDREGNIVNGLTALDFTLLDNGKPQAVNVDTLAHPISLVVAVQANSVVESILPKIQKIGSVFDQLVIG